MSKRCQPWRNRRKKVMCFLKVMSELFRVTVLADPAADTVLATGYKALRINVVLKNSKRVRISVFRLRTTSAS